MDERTDQPSIDVAAAGWAALGALLLNIATWLNSSEAKAVTGSPSADDVIALLIGLIGVALFIPLVRQLFDIYKQRWILPYGIAGIALLLLGGAIGFNISHLSDSSPAYPHTVLVPMNPIPLKGLPVVRQNEPILFNVGLSNLGPGLAREVTWAGRIKVFNTPTSNTEEAAFVDEMSNDLVPKISMDLPPGKSSYTTLMLGLNEAHVQAISNDSERIYVFLVGSWEDESGTHNFEQCVYLRPPGNEAVWRACNSHNVLH